jgi:HD-GYP domain-containing protein (c-di-GMP phosphodiesterase class II)
MGYAPEKAVRSCLLATGLARGLDLAEEEVRDVYLTTLLRHLGCTATTHEEAYIFGGDEIASRPAAERTDFGRASEVMRLTLQTGRGTGLSRPRYLARALRSGKKGGELIFRAICEVASHLAERLGLGEGVERALYQVLERWDGKGSPEGLSGDDISLPARIAEVATQAVIFDRAEGPDAAVGVVARRAGGWFDPAIAEAFRTHGPALLAEIAAGDPWAAVLESGPQPVRLVGPADLDRVARAFADMVDLKSPYTLGPSSEEAEIAEEAARSLGSPDQEIDDLRRAALLHDVGRVAVSDSIWDKPGSLATAEWESVRLHPYYTERILARSSALAPLVPIAGMHHERQDGGGYHHGAAGPKIPTAARILAAADAYQAMTRDRPHRGARSAEEAAETLGADASPAAWTPSVCGPLWRPPVTGKSACGRDGRPGSAIARSRCSASSPGAFEPGDRQAAVHLAPHGRASRPTRLREDRDLHARLGRCVRHGARPAPPAAGEIGSSTDALAPRAPPC